MGNQSCAPQDATSKLVASYFPLNKELNFGDPRVYVPLWNGGGSIHVIQKVLPSEVPNHPIPEGCALPGETVHPEDVPSQLYNLTGTDAYAYGGATGFEDAAAAEPFYEDHRGREENSGIDSFTSDDTSSDKSINDTGAEQTSEFGVAGEGSNIPTPTPSGENLLNLSSRKSATSQR